MRTLITRLIEFFLGNFGSLECCAALILTFLAIEGGTFFSLLSNECTKGKPATSSYNASANKSSAVHQRFRFGYLGKQFEKLEFRVEDFWLGQFLRTRQTGTQYIPSAI